MEHLEIYYSNDQGFFDKYLSSDNFNMGTWQSKHGDIHHINKILEPYDIIAEEITSGTPFGSVLIGFKLTGEAAALSYFKMKYL